jgi:hypothetical protein
MIGVAGNHSKDNFRSDGVAEELSLSVADSSDAACYDRPSIQSILVATNVPRIR